MWLALLVLFVVLSPGVLFTLPALGKKMGGKFVIALMHSLLFVVVVALLNVTEAFQVSTSGKTQKVMPKLTPEQTLRMAEQGLQRNIDTLARLKESVVRVTQQIESNNSQVNELRQQLATVQAANLAAQEKVNERNAALSDAQKEVLDTTTNMNMITNKISSLTRRVGMTKGGVIGNRTLPEQELARLNTSINNTNAAITRSQAAVNAAKLAMNASNTVQKVAEAPASMDSGSKVQDVAQAAEVARTAQVDAEAAVRVAAPPKVSTQIDISSSPVTTVASMLGIGPGGGLVCGEGMYKVSDGTGNTACVACTKTVKSTGNPAVDSENRNSMISTCI